LGVDVLDIQFKLGYFGYSLGYISKYWANFCSIFLVGLWLTKFKLVGIETMCLCSKSAYFYNQLSIAFSMLLSYFTI
jgi:hypothetical protein